jgi:hypothetical protein
VKAVAGLGARRVLAGAEVEVGADREGVRRQIGGGARGVAVGVDDDVREVAAEGALEARAVLGQHRLAGAGQRVQHLLWIAPRPRPQLDASRLLGQHLDVVDVLLERLLQTPGEASGPGAAPRGEPRLVVGRQSRPADGLLRRRQPRRSRATARRNRRLIGSPLARPHPELRRAAHRQRPLSGRERRRGAQRVELVEVEGLDLVRPHVAGSRLRGGEGARGRRDRYAPLLRGPLPVE